MGGSIHHSHQLQHQHISQMPPQRIPDSLTTATSAGLSGGGGATTIGGGGSGGGSVGGSANGTLLGMARGFSGRRAREDAERLGISYCINVFFFFASDSLLTNYFPPNL